MMDKPSQGLPRVPGSEEGHWMICPVCGERVDLRDLMQVLDHWHEDDAVVAFGPPTIRGHERRVAERYAKKTLAHINWLRTLPPLESGNVRRRDVLRQCLLFREVIRSGDEIPGFPAAHYLRSAQHALVLIRKMRAIAKRSLH
jgi:hypothetical protein